MEYIDVSNFVVCTQRDSKRVIVLNNVEHPLRPDSSQLQINKHFPTIQYRNIFQDLIETPTKYQLEVLLRNKQKIEHHLGPSDKTEGICCELLASWKVNDSKGWALTGRHSSIRYPCWAKKRSGKDHFWRTNCCIDTVSGVQRWQWNVCCHIRIVYACYFCFRFGLDLVVGAMSGCFMWAWDQHHLCGTHLPSDPMFINGRLDIILLRIIQM